MKLLTIIFLFVSSISFGQSSVGYVLVMDDSTVRLPGGSVRNEMIQALSIGKITGLQAILDGKQSVLQSGISIKTINGGSILGGGDMVISAAWNDISGKPTNTSWLSNSANKNFVNDAQLVTIGNTSGANTGDNAPNTQYSGLAASKQDVLVNQTNIKSINGTSLLGSGNIAIAGAGPTFIPLAQNFVSTSTTPAAVTGWSFAVTAGVTYLIEVIGAFQTSATTTGCVIGISLTGGATGTVRGVAEGTIVNTAAASSLAIPIVATSGAGSTLTTTGTSAIGAPHYVGMRLTFTCTVSGTFNIVWATEVNASGSQLNANSSLTYQALN